MDELQGPRSILLSSISNNRPLSSVGSRVWHYPSDNRKWSFYKHQGRWAEQESPFHLCKEVNQGQGQGQDKDPTQETKPSLFHPTNRQSRPWSSLRHSDTVISAWISSKADGTHTCLSHKEISIEYRWTFDFKLPNFLVAPPRKTVVKCTPSESASFIGLLTLSQLSVRKILVKTVTWVLE